MLLKKIIKIILLQFSFRKKLKDINFLDIKTFFFYNKKSSFLFEEKNIKSSISIDYNNYKKYLEKTSYIKSNAEIYFLDTNVQKKIDNLFIDTKYIALPINSIFISFFKIFNLIKSKNFVFLGIKRIKKRYIILENIYYNPINNRTRRYIPQNFTRKSFLQHLKISSLDYVILRWFDKLESFKGNLEEDIDILINDNSVKKISDILNSNVGILPVDIYSLSGTNGTSYAGLPYYPYNFSKDILKTKIIHNDNFYIPNKINYLLSLTYHIVFHKSVKSGLPISDKIKNNQNQDVDHAYKSIVQKELDKNEIKLKKITLLNLKKILEEFKCTPSYDLLLKLSNIKKNDEFIKMLIKSKEESIKNDFKKIVGLSILIIRERAYKYFRAEKVLSILDSFGFEVLDMNEIEENLIDNIKENIRGGNWGQGPFKISGGYPIYYIVAYDPFYVEPSKEVLIKYPNLENEKIVALKRELRNFFSNNLSEYGFNGVHSSDNFYESIDYLEQIYNFDKQKISKILHKCTESKNFYFHKNYTILKDLSKHSNRAKVNLIDYNGKKAIKKTFKTNKKDFFERELLIFSIFKEKEFIPNLYFKGDNYFICEYFEDAIELKYYKKITPNIILQLKNILKIFYDNNITLLDINPLNILIVNKQVKLIDFEFCYIYSVKPISFSEIYELSSIPKTFQGKIPKGYEGIDSYYDFFLKNIFLLSKNQFIKLNNKFQISVVIKYNKFCRLFKIVINKINIHRLK